MIAGPPALPGGRRLPRASAVAALVLLAAALGGCGGRQSILAPSRSAIVGVTSRLRMRLGFVLPPVCPGAFTNIGTGAISSTFRSVASRRSFTPTSKA